MRDYEIVLVVSPTGGDDGFTAIVERVNQFIKDQGGEIVKVDPWGIRKLAYPINRHMEAFYAVTDFKLDPEAVSKLEDEVGRMEEILRHIVTRQDEAQVEASAKASLKAPAAVAAKAPADAPAEAAAEKPAEASAEAPAEAPAKAPAEAPAEAQEENADVGTK